MQAVTAKASEARELAEQYRSGGAGAEGAAGGAALILLVIDTQETDWSRYFKGRKVLEREVSPILCLSLNSFLKLARTKSHNFF